MSDDYPRVLAIHSYVLGVGRRTGWADRSGSQLVRLQPSTGFQLTCPRADRYTARNDKELSFAMGDEIAVHEIMSEQW